MKDNYLWQNLILDGAMGSQLMLRAALKTGEPTELVNLTNPQIVYDVHCDYIKAGANIIYTNTFCANPYKLANYGEVIKSAIAIARRAACSAGREVLVALDIGSLGKLIGEGGIGFEEAINAFKNMLAYSDGADLIVFETMTDLAEVRAALIAAQEASSLKYISSMSFETSGRTFFGTPIECFAITAQSLGASAVGINCGLGPKQMYPLAQRLCAATSLPVFVKANAGLPRLENGATVYDVGADEFAEYMAKIKAAGVNILGGCCGTTPEYISKTVELSGAIERSPRVKSKNCVCSYSGYVELAATKIIGERINPTGKKRFQAALAIGDYDYIVSQALEQQDAGADMLDVNVGMNGIDEVAVLSETVKRIQEVCPLPLQIDTSNVAALESALRVYNGRALINSVNGKEESLSSIIPLAKKYGAVLVGLALDENGIPDSIDKRVAVAKKIIERCKNAGIGEGDIFIDTLTMSEASERGSALITLNSLEKVKSLGVGTVLGVSNVSFGMPNRQDINAAFLQMSVEKGLDLCIINPQLKNITGSDYAFDFLRGEAGGAERYIEYASQAAAIEVKKPESELTLAEAIITGRRDKAKSLAAELIQNCAVEQIVADEIIPALDEVGKLYEQGKLFLPQLLSAAESAKSAFAVFPVSDAQTDNKKVFVLATVKGDVHDIGKNIVKTVVSNYGYKVIDLGKDVAIERVVEAVDRYYPCVLGLSALMTTTVENMQKTITKVREKYAKIEILVGGAVLTEEYAGLIGGTYCRDAADTVKNLKRIYG